MEKTLVTRLPLRVGVAVSMLVASGLASARAAIERVARSADEVQRELGAADAC